jgi:cold shock CspA family protein
MDEDGNITSTPPDPSKKRSTIKAEDIPVSTPKQSSTPTDAVRKGAITYFDDSKGYGFIRDNETQESVFVHVNGLIDDVREGDKVSFETVKGQKGPNAVNVKRL